MRRISLALFLISAQLLASGCSALRSRSTAPAEPPSANVQIRHVDAKDLSDVRPDIRRQAELLYDVLVGEFAGYRGRLKLAVKYYLKAADESKDPAVAQRAAQIALYGRNEAGALAATRRWAEISPASVDAHRTLAVLYLRHGELKRSADQLEILVNLTKGDPGHGFYLISQLFAREQDQKAALTTMAMLVDRHAQDPYAQYAYGTLALHAEQPEVALTAVDRAIADKPGWNDAILLRARILMQQGKTEAALQSMETAIKANPDSRALRISYGRLLAEARHFGKARQQFDHLLRKSPKDGELLYAMALLSIEDKQYTLAEGYLKRLVKTGKRTADAYFYLGAIDESRGKPEQAIRWYRKVRSGERRVDAHIRVAILTAKQGHLEKARRELFKMRPPNEATAVRFYIVEADMLRDAGRDQEALDVVDKALAQMPGENDLLYARAMLAEKLGHLDVLERDLRQILATDPDNTHALNALGYTLADRTHRYKEALAYIEKALAQSPNEPAILDSMGWVQYRLGNLTKARDYLQRAYKADKDSEIAAHLGEVLWVSGEHGAAREVWRKALKADPASVALKKVIKRFDK